MHNVFKGIVVGILGFILWVTTSVMGGVLAGLGDSVPSSLMIGMYLGFFLMVGGPIIYILIIPIMNRLRRRS